MEASHVQQIMEDFGPQDTLDFKYDTLMEIIKQFFLEPSEELKKNLIVDLYDKIKDLIRQFEIRVNKLNDKKLGLKAAIFD